MELLNQQQFVAVLAGALFTFSISGLGLLIHAALRRRQIYTPDSLIPGWGLAFLLSLSYIILCFPKTNPQFIWPLVLAIGASIATLYLLKELGSYLILKKHTAVPTIDIFIFIALLTMLTLDCYISLYDIKGNCFDDHIAYWPQIKKLLETGSLADPFGFRRIASLGGQQVVQSYFALLAPVHFLQFFEHGVCRLILYVVSFRYLLSQKILLMQGRSNVLLPLALLYSLDNMTLPDSNTAALHLPTILLISYFIFRLWTFNNCFRGGAYLLGALLGGMMYFRANYLIGTCVILFLELVQSFRSSSNGTLRFSFPLKILLTTVIVMLPGMFLLWQSSATPFWPLLQGNYSNHFQTFIGPVPDGGLQKYWHYLLTDSSFWICLLILGCSLTVASHKIILLAPPISYIVSIIVIGHSTRGTLDAGSVLRYSYPYYFASIVIFAHFFAYRLNQLWPTAEKLWLWISSHNRWLRSSLLIFLSLTLIEISEDAWSYLKNKITYSSQLIENKIAKSDLSILTSRRELYQHLIRNLPAHENILVAVEHPFLLDFARSSLTLLDYPGVASPGQELNFEDTAQKIDTYLHSQGFRYLLFEDPEKCDCAYSFSTWNSFLRYPVEKRDFRYYWALSFRKYFSYLKEKQNTQLVLNQGPFYLVKISQGSSQ